jgi:hypothetical protein
MRHIGVFFAGLDRNDPEVTARVAAFQQALAGLGWIDGPRRDAG